MEERRSPTLRLRRLSDVMREHREAVPLTGSEVERRLEWPAGKISRLERGRSTRPSVKDIRELLDLYGIADEVQREEILTWTRDSRKRGWWSSYNAEISEEYGKYIGFEAEAKGLSTFDNSIIFGLLQTPAYARALMTDTVRALTEQKIEQRVEIRVNRQQLLYGEGAMQLTVVLDEAVLRRVIGSQDIMREQLGHLQKVAELPNVALHVVPFGAGTAATTHGSFSILEFPHAHDREAVYIETLAGELFVEEPEDVRLYELLFRQLMGSALDRPQSLAMLAELV